MLETLYDSENLNERCGIVLKDGSIVEIDNVADEPEKGYDMRPEAILPYVRDDQVAETWHTHPQGDPNLSGEDHDGFLAWPDLIHNVIGVREGKVTVTRWKIQYGLVIECD